MKTLGGQKKPVDLRHQNTNTDMSYDNRNCVCGGKKPTDTMLCDDCNAWLENDRDMKTFRDGTQPVWHRRSAAIKLLSLCRKRNNLRMQLKSLDAFEAQSRRANLNVGEPANAALCHGDEPLGASASPKIVNGSSPLASASGSDASKSQ